jgi:hypothetical protein
MVYLLDHAMAKAPSFASASWQPRSCVTAPAQMASLPWTLVSIELV